jgi:hypothetical protein
VSSDAEWVFLILGVRVHARNLPTNNMAVAHCYDEAVRNVIEPICRGRGHRDPEYKNRMIFDRFRETVLEE